METEDFPERAVGVRNRHSEVDSRFRGVPEATARIMDASHRMQLTTNNSVGRGRLKRVLSDAAESGEFRYAAYVSPEYMGRRKAGTAVSQTEVVSIEDLLGQRPEVAAQVAQSETGAVVFAGDERVLVILPPFPIAEASFHADAHVAPMLSLLDTRPVVAVVLLRLGRYAVGVIGGDRLLASKTGTRYVKNRHRQGGSSQRRFERSRERLVRELYDKVCAVAGDVVGPFGDRIDYLMLGGDRHTLNGFVKRCRLVRDFGPKTMDRRLPVDRPGQKALEAATRDIWVCKVLTFARPEV